MKRYSDDSTIKMLLKLIDVIDVKDNYTKLHSKNVSKYALILGKELKFSEEQLEVIELGAMLHDVGKIGVFDFVLMKKRPLTVDEIDMLKTHVIIGDELLSVEGYEEVRKMIRGHHERIDGRGYPDGLKGTEISYFTRILSVADTFDAMTTKRSYNCPKTLEEAIIELYRISNKQINEDGNIIIQQLDPYLVNSFVKAIKKDLKLMEYFEKRDLEIISNRQSKKFIKRKN